jgi:hypothetical protein
VVIAEDEELIQVRFRAKGPAGEEGIMGDMRKFVRPGGTLFGKTYEELLKHGNGEMEFE